MSEEEHKARHVELHKNLDELLADFIKQTGKTPSQTTLMELLIMSLMLNGDVTLGQAWMSQGRLSALMPPVDDEFEVVEGEVK